MPLSRDAGGRKRCQSDPQRQRANEGVLAVYSVLPALNDWTVVSEHGSVRPDVETGVGVADMVTAALVARGLSVTAGADLCDVDRIFLNRLTQGKRPPRARAGWRGADEDPRYRKLAKGLGLDVEVFLEAVRAEQRDPEQETILNDAEVRAFVARCLEAYTAAADPFQDLDECEVPISALAFTLVRALGKAAGLADLENAVLGDPGYGGTRRRVRQHTEAFLRLAGGPAEPSPAWRRACRLLGHALLRAEGPASPEARQRMFLIAARVGASPEFLSRIVEVGRT